MRVVILTKPSTKAMKPSTSQLAGHYGSLSLRQVLRCWDVPPCDLILLRWGWWQLFILHFCFGHVVITRVKILLLDKQDNIKSECGTLVLLKESTCTWSATNPFLKSFPEKVWASRLSSNVWIPGLQFGLLRFFWTDYFVLHFLLG